MRVLVLILAVLAVARLARLIADDEITLPLRKWLIERYGASSFIVKLALCAPWCMSLWFSLVMPIAVIWPSLWLAAVLSVPAGSMAAAILLKMADRE